MVVTTSHRSKSRRLSSMAQQVGVGFLNVEAHSEQLLPGISDEITLHEITPKLSWKDFYALVLTSSYWRDAIQSHHVYNARIQSHSTETLVLVNYGQEIGLETFPATALFSTRDDSLTSLPPLPHLDRPGIPTNCQSVALDGKIYVLGGMIGGGANVRTNQVYVLDVAGLGQWKECAHMQRALQDFGCAVVGKKIYVFGGPPSVAEAYDPKENTWSSITPALTSLQTCTSAATMGEDILLFGGYPYVPLCIYQPYLPLCIYHQAKDEWWELARFDGRATKTRTVEKLFSLRYDRVQPCDLHRNSQKQPLSRSFAGLGKFGDRIKIFERVEGSLTVEDEILAISTYHDRRREFGSETGGIAWQKIQFGIPSSSWDGRTKNFICTVQL